MYNMCAGDSQEEQLHAKRTMSERQKKKNCWQTTTLRGQKIQKPNVNELISAGEMHQNMYM